MNMRSLLIGSALAALTACGSTLTEPVSDLSGLPDGLEATLVVDPGEVRQSQTFDVTVIVRNTTSDTIRVITSHGCLVTPHVMQDGRRIPFAGSWYACTAAITSHVFAPGATRTIRWEMRAELYAEYSGEVDGRPAPKGWYGVVAEFDMRGADGEKPFLSRVLRVD